jgi:hypothetical protein
MVFKSKKETLKQFDLAKKLNKEISLVQNVQD